MAAIYFRGGIGLSINDLGGSAVGLYGDVFGRAVKVGFYQERCYITNALGLTQGQECNNVKYFNTTQATLGQGTTPVNLRAIPNYQSSLGIRFIHDTAVQVMNTKTRIFDRANINNAPTGVICRIAQIIHPSTTQVENGTGDTNWHTPAGTADIVSLVDSPGFSGTTPNGTGDTIHDWFLIMSATPQNIGSKTKFGLYVETEYL